MKSVIYQRKSLLWKQFKSCVYGTINIFDILSRLGDVRSQNKSIIIPT